MALLGKISAVLTASTADFTRKIGLAKSDLADFQKRVSGIRLNLNTRALDGTLTKLQKFKREVDEISRLRGLGVDLGFDPKRLTDQFKAFEEIGRPLTDVKNKIEGLSNAIQSELYPELEKVQTGFRNLYRDIEAGTTTWERSEKRASALAASLTRLSRATAAASDIGNLAGRLRQENVGASFFQPSTQEALQRSLALRGQAQQIPARFRSSAFADLANSAEENAERIEKQAARVIAIEARIARQGATPNLLSARALAQENLDSLTRRQEGINAGFQRQIREAQIREIVTPEAVSGAEKALGLFRTMSEELRKIDSTRFNSLIASVGRVVDGFNNAQVSASKAKAAIETLGRATVAARIESALTQQADSVLGTRSGADIAAIRSAAVSQRNQIFNDRSLTRADRLSRAGLVNANENILLEREAFNRSVLPRISSALSDSSSLGSPELSRRAEDLKRNAIELNNLLKSAARSTDEAFKTNAIETYKASVFGLVKELDAFDKAAKSAAASQRQFQQFVSLSGGRGVTLDPTLEGVASDIMVARQFRGQYDPSNDRGRIAVANQIERAEKRVESIIRRRQQLETASTNNEEKRIRAYRRANALIERQGELLLKRAAAESGGQRSEAQVMAAARRARKSSGSLGLGASSAAQLALQQGLFAVDDLISSTGGIEYKLRAIGNNITQLGLLLGQSGLIPGLTATKGLFIALGAVIAGQVASSLVRFVNNGRTTEDQVKALNDALSKQKNLVEQLAKSYERVGEAIQDAGLSSSQRRDAQIGRQIEEIQRQQREAREARILAVDPGVARARADVARAERTVSEASTVPASILAQLELRAARDRQTAEERRAVSNAERPIDNIRQAVVGAIEQSLRGQMQRPEDLAGRTGGFGGGAGFDAIRNAILEANAALGQQILDLQNVAADPQALADAIDARVSQIRQSSELQITKETLITPLQQLREQLLVYTRQLEADELGARISESVLRAGSQLDDALENIQAAFGDSADFTQVSGRLRLLSESLKTLQQQSADAATQGRPEEARAINDRVTALRQDITTTLDATSALRRFAETLDLASQEAQRNLQSAQQAADDARRRQLGFDTPANRQSREQAEFSVRLQRDASLAVEQEIASAIERAVERADSTQGAALRNIESQLATSGVLTAEARDQLLRERVAIQRQVVDQDQAVQQARDASTREEERRQSALRGRELLRGEGGRAAEEAVNQVRDLRQATRESVARAISEGRFGDIAGIQQQSRDAEQRLIAEQQRAAAPAIFNLADSVQNAILQGPSRAALNASDISTQEGARELNRLLRGEDAARDQNLIELQRQSTVLEEMLRTVKDGVNGVQAA
jgi:hypothetical protein